MRIKIFLGGRCRTKCYKICVWVATCCRPLCVAACLLLMIRQQQRRRRQLSAQTAAVWAGLRYQRCRQGEKGTCVRMFLARSFDVWVYVRGLFRQLGLFAEFHLEEKLVFLRAAERATRRPAPRATTCMMASKSTLSAASCS